MLGTFFAVCSAACFAFNNASVRRGVLSGSIIQGMAITVPIGVPLFFILTLVTGNLATVAGFSPAALVGAVRRRHRALRVGPLLELPRHPRHGLKSCGAAAADEPAGLARGRDCVARRISHAAEDLRHRAHPARADAHHFGAQAGAERARRHRGEDHAHRCREAGGIRAEISRRGFCFRSWPRPARA